MTDAPTTHDRTADRPTTGDDRTPDRPTTDDDRTADGAPATAETAEPRRSAGLRGLVKGGAAALLGLTGLGALGDTASAATSRKHLLVVGYGRGRHTYEITMKSGGTIRKSSFAGGNDSTSTTWNGNQQASGEVWHWRADSYTYTGEIDSVRGDGNLAFHFKDGAFRSATAVHLTGQASGRHLYAMMTPRGDIDLGTSTEYVDSDDGIGYADGERHWTQDRVSGAVRNWNYDSYDLGSDDAIQTITVEQGHVEFYR